MMTWIWVVLAGLVTSFLYTKYIKAVSRNRAIAASMADFGLMFMGSLMTQVWFYQGNDFRIFLLFDLVAALGTYLAVKHHGT